MSSGNFEFERQRNFKKNAKTVTGTYTIRTGKTQNGVVDNPVLFTDLADDITVTLGDGAYIGQEIMIVMTSNTNSKTATVNVLKHETSNPEDRIHNAADEYSFMIWTGTEWVNIAKTSTDS